MIVFQYILFFLASVFSFYIPGKIFINFLKLSLKPFDSFVISWFAGISLFLLGTYIFSWIQIPQAYFFLLIALNIYAILKKRKTLFKLEKIDYLSLFIIALGSLSFLYIMFFSGFISNAGIQFLGVNGQDGIKHIAYIKNQVFTFPPQHQGLYGVELKGYHYFYDFLLAKFSQFYLFSVEDLYFRLFPLLISVLYGLSFYFLSRKLSSNLNANRLIIFFAYFAQSFPLLSNSPIVHPIGLIVNPFIVLAIGMLVVGIALLPEVKKSFKYAIIVGLILGVLSQVKVYTGLIAIGTISIFALYIFLRFKKKYFFNYLTLLVVTAVFTAITFLPNNFRQGGLVFYPLEFYKHYISSHGFEGLNWDTRRMIFEQHNNYLRIIILYIEAIIIFWIYNLGILSVVLFRVKNLFKKSFWLNEFNIIIALSVTIPIFIASFFLQSVSAFDTVQFLWIVIPLFGVPAGIIFAQYINRNKFIGLFLISLILLLFIPGYLDVVGKYNPFKRIQTVSRSELEFYGIINNIVPKNSFLIYIPENKLLEKQTDFYKEGAPVISAISGRGVYLEGGNLPNKLDKVYAERFSNILALNKAINSCDLNSITRELNKIGSKYILTENKYPCLLNRSSISEINSNKYTLYIYK